MLIKHLTSTGNLFTRSTERPYTHVVVARKVGNYSLPFVNGKMTYYPNQHGSHYVVVLSAHRGEAAAKKAAGPRIARTDLFADIAVEAINGGLPEVAARGRGARR